MIRRIKSRTMRTVVAWLVLPILALISLPMALVVGLLVTWQGGKITDYLAALPWRQSADLMLNRN